MLDILSGLNIVLIVELIITGFIIGVVAAMVGIGGGLLTVPALVLLFTRSAQVAGAISIVVIIFTSGSASLINFKHRRIDLRTGFFFAVLVIPSSFIGGWVAENIHDENILIILFGLLMLIVSIDRIRKLIVQARNNRQNSSSPIQPSDSSDSKQDNSQEIRSLIPQSVEKRILIDDEGKKFSYTVRLRWTLLGAIIGGFTGGLLGLGGGIIFVPVLLASGLPPHIAVATSSFIIIFTALSGSLSRLLYGNIPWDYVIPLAIGTVSGARFGALKVKKISSQKVLILFYVIVFLSGVRMILKAYGLFP